MNIPGTMRTYNGREEAEAIRRGPGPWFAPGAPRPMVRQAAVDGFGASLLETFLPGMSDAAMKQMAEKTVEYGWPVVEEKLKPYLVMGAGLAIVGYAGLVYLLLRKG